MKEDEREEPFWTPWAYIGTGILGILIIIFALSSGQAGLIEALILGVSVAVIIVGVKKLRERRT
jgi:hypothetical protein